MLARSRGRTAAPTPDDSRLITPETTPPSIPITPATPPCASRPGT